MPRFAHTPEKTAKARELRRQVSRSEAWLWPHLRSGRAGASFRRQHVIGPFFADYACPSLRLVIEVDGEGHDARRDRARDAFMRAHGWFVLRFSAADALRETEGCVEAILAAVRARKVLRGLA